MVANAVRIRVNAGVVKTVVVAVRVEPVWVAVLIKVACAVGFDLNRIKKVTCAVCREYWIKSDLCRCLTRGHSVNPCIGSPTEACHR